MTRFIHVQAHNGESPRPKHTSTIASAVGAQALGAFAVVAIAIGALAIGRLAIGRFFLEKGRVRSLEIENLK
jgi:hypothetical protein